MPRPQQISAGSKAALVVAALVVVLYAFWNPRSLALVGAIASGAALLAVWRRPARAIAELSLPAAVLAFYAFAGFALLSTAWSADVRESLTKPLYLMLLIGGVHAAAMLLARAGAEQLAGIRAVLLAMLLVGIALTAVESATDQLVSRKIYTAFPSLRKGLEEHVSMLDGVATRISETNIKRRVGAFTLLLAPAALIMLQLARFRHRNAMIVALAALAVVMIYASPHQSSWVAGALGAFVLLLAYCSRQAAGRFLQAGFAAWTLLAIPLVWAAHKSELHKASWVPNSARHRVVIWNTTVNEALNAPFIGVGANATRKIFEDREAASPATERDEGTYIKGLTRHAHNAYVQVWYELGAVGAMLLALAGVMAIRAIARLPHMAQPLAYAQFAATAAVMSSSYGIWQIWFLASMAIAGTALLVAALGPATSASGGPGDPARRGNKDSPVSVPTV
jgi:O-antigen ligase